MTKPTARGLNALLSRSTHSSPKKDPAGPPTMEILLVMVSPSPFQPREHFRQDTLDELVVSVREKGILQPLLVRPRGKDRFELIAGERRLRAAKLAGLERVPVIVRDISDTESLEISLIENLQRDDLNALEVARGYRELVELFGFSHEDVAQKVGKSRSGVANALRLLELPEGVQRLLAEGKLTAGHARALLACKTPVQMEKLAVLAIDRNLSVRALEGIVYGKSGARRKKSGNGRSSAPHIAALEAALSERLGTKVTVVEGASKGRIIIEFYSNDDFERILESMGLQ